MSEIPSRTWRILAGGSLAALLASLLVILGGLLLFVLLRAEPPPSEDGEDRVADEAAQASPRLPGPSAPHRPSLPSHEASQARQPAAASRQSPAWIRGEVRDMQGEPVHGALVEALSENEAADASHLRVETDRRGAFVLQDLSQDVYHLVAKHERSCSEISRIDLTTLPFRDKLVIVLQEGSIEGVVTSEDGTPQADISVIAAGFTSVSMMVAKARSTDLLTGATATTDESGEFVLAPLQSGSYKVWARPEKAPPCTRYLQTGLKSVIAHTGDKDVRLVVPSLGGIRGRVVLEGKPSPGPFALVLSDREQVGAFDIPARFDGEDGLFVVEKIPRGIYTLFLAGQNFRQKTVDRAFVLENRTTDLGIIHVDGGRSLTGRILGDSGPVAGAKVKVGSTFHGGDGDLGESSKVWLEDERQALSAGDGRYHIAGLSEEGRFLKAEHPRWGVSKIRIIPAGKKDQRIDLRLHAPARIYGRVTRQGQGSSDMRVFLQGSLQRQFSQMKQTADDGSYSFDALSPGEYSIRAEENKFLPQHFDGQKLRLRPGQDMKHDIELGPMGHSLEVLLQMRPEDADTTFQVYKILGAVEARTVDELRPHMTFGRDGFEISWIEPKAGNVALFRDVPDGPVTVCVHPQSGLSRGKKIPVTEVNCATLTLVPEKREAQIELRWPPTSLGFPAGR